MRREHGMRRVSVKHHLAAKALKTEELCGLITTEAWTVKSIHTHPPKTKNCQAVWFPKVDNFYEFSFSEVSENQELGKMGTFRPSNASGAISQQFPEKQRTHLSVVICYTTPPPPQPSRNEWVSNKSRILNRKWFFSWGCLKKKRATVSQSACSEMTVLLTHPEISFMAWLCWLTAVTRSIGAGAGCEVKVIQRRRRCDCLFRFGLWGVKGSLRGTDLVASEMFFAVL